jgi:hypothetical protein
MSNPFATGYREPSAQSNFLKFSEDGSYVFRILTPKNEVLTYFRAFIENPAEGQSKKLILQDKGDGTIPTAPKDLKLKVTFENENPIKLVWAVKILNIDTQDVQIWEITQATLRKNLFAIATGKVKNDWTKFDIQITKTTTKTGNKTKIDYQLITDDNRELTQEELEIINSKPVNLKAMELNKDPFEISLQAEVSKSVNLEMPEINVDEITTVMPF